MLSICSLVTICFILSSILFNIILILLLYPWRCIWFFFESFPWSIYNIVVCLKNIPCVVCHSLIRVISFISLLWLICKNWYPNMKFLGANIIFTKVSKYQYFWESLYLDMHWIIFGHRWLISVITLRFRRPGLWSRSHDFDSGYYIKSSRHNRWLRVRIICILH